MKIRNLMVALPIAVGLVAFTSANATAGRPDGQAAGQASLAATKSQASLQDTFYGCPEYYLCFYTGANFNNWTGNPQWKQKYCGTYNLSGWVTRHGSFVNNQTQYTESVFYSGYGGGGQVLTRHKAKGWDLDYDFYPVNSVKVC